MKDAADLLTAIGTLLWPITAALVLILLLPTVRSIIRNRPFTIKIGSFEMTAQEASDNLTQQIADLQKQVGSLKATFAQSDTSEDGEPEAPATARPVDRVLWVDDHPEHNAFEIERLREADVDVTTATSTDKALALIRADGSRYQTLVTDLGRREGLQYHKQAGLDTVEEARKAGFNGTAIIYTNQDGVASAAAKAARLKIAVTASPTELYRLLGIT